MIITIETDDFLNDESYERVGKALRIAVTDDEITAIAGRDNLSETEEKDIKYNLLKEKLKVPLRSIIMAAFDEYAEMIIGKQVATKADDIIKRKIYHLIKRYFLKRFPTESEIISIFQITEATSRRLLRELRASNRTDLEEEIDNSVKDTLSEPKGKRGNDIIILIKSENILEEIKQTVSIEAAELDQVQKQKNSACTYGIPIDTYRKLCESYNLNFEELTEKL